MITGALAESSALPVALAQGPSDEALPPAFVPSDIAGIWWLRADLGFTASPLSWLDQGAGGHNAAEISGSKNPSLLASAIDGRPALRFDGTNDALDVLNVTSWPGGTDLYLGCVYDFKTGQTGATGLLSLGSGSFPLFAFASQGPSGGYALRTSSGWEETTDPVQTGWHFVEYVLDTAGGAEVRVDGVAQAGALTWTGTSVAGSGLILCHGVGPYAFPELDLAEAVSLPGIPTPSEQAGLLAYIAARYPSLAI